MSLPAFTKTQAFSVKTPGTVDNLNTGQGAAVAIVEGAKAIEKLVTYVRASTITGTQNDYAIDTLAVAPAVAIAIMQWNGASAATINGLTGGVDGRRLVVRNMTASYTLTLADQAAGSTAANRLNCGGGNLLLAPGGSIELWYDGTASRWVLLADRVDWTAIAFNAANFTASGSMTWTVGAGDQTTFAYRRDGKTLLVTFYLVATTVGGTPSTGLRVAIPGGYVAARSTLTPVYIDDNGAVGLGFANISAGATYIQVFRADVANWAASTNATGVYGTLQFEVN